MNIITRIIIGFCIYGIGYFISDSYIAGWIFGGIAILIGLSIED